MTHQYKNIINLILGLTLINSCKNESLDDNSSSGETSSGIYITTSDMMTNGEMSSVDTSSEQMKYDVFVSTGDVGSCADISVSVNQIIPTIVILIDRSGSMNIDFGGISRWQALYNSIMNQTDGVVYSLQNEISFGVALYDGTAETCPEIIYVVPNISNYQIINDVYSLYSPNSDTPTGESIDVVQNMLSNILSDEPKAIVLATDGEPDLCSDSDGDGKELVIEATQSAYNNDIKTYVISVGLDTSSAHLQEVANVGVGKPRDEAIDPAPFYETIDQTELLQAFQNIIGDFVSCQYEINGQINPDDICSGKVLVDNKEINCGTDWDVQGNILEIYGQSCDILKDGNVHTIDAKFPCDTIYIP